MEQDVQDTRLHAHTHTHTHTYTHAHRLLWTPISLFWPHSRRNQTSPLPRPLDLLSKTPPTLTVNFPNSTAQWESLIWKSANVSTKLTMTGDKREQWERASTNMMTNVWSWKWTMIRSSHHQTCQNKLPDQTMLGTSCFNFMRITALPTLVRGGREAIWLTQETHSRKIWYEHMYTTCFKCVIISKFGRSVYSLKWWWFSFWQLHIVRNLCLASRPHDLASLSWGGLKYLIETSVR